MELFKGLLCLSLVLPGLSVVTAGESDGLVLAKVNGEALTLGEMKAEFHQRHQGHMVLLGDEDVVREFLDSAIRRRLLIQEAYRLDLHQDPEIVRAVEDQRGRVAAQWLFAEVEAGVEVAPEAVEQALSRIGVLYEIIRVQTDTEDEARAARSRVVAGEQAEALARELSVAPSRTRGGLEALVWGQDDPELERAVFAAEPGDVTPVIAVETGFAFASIADRKQVEIEELDLARPKVEQTLRRRAVTASKIDYLDRLRERYHARLYPERITPEILVSLLESEAEVVAPDDPAVAEYDGGAISRSEFAASIRARVFLTLMPAMQALQAANLLDNRLDQRLVRLEGQRRWQEAPAEKKLEVGAIRDDLMFRTLLTRYVFQGVEVTDADVESWYDEHRDDHMTPVKIKLAIALLDSEQDAADFLDQVLSGADFGELAAERSKDRQTAAHRGVAGWVTEERAIPALRGESFEQPVGATGGPLEMETGWLVYRILERAEPRQRSLDEVREQIHAELMEVATGARLAEWETQLWKNGRVKFQDRAIRKGSRILGAESAEKLHDDSLAEPSPSSPHGTPR